MRRWRWLGYLAAAGFWVSSVSYAVTSLDIAGPAEPAASPDLNSYLAAYLTYRRDLFPFEQVTNWSLAVALIAVAVLAELWHLAWVGSDRILSHVSSMLVMIGAVVAAVTQIAYLGALDRVLFASTIELFDPAPLGTMIDAAGRTDDYVENFGLLLLAIGVLGMTRLNGQSARTPRGWTVLCLALALGLATIVATSFAGSAANNVALVVVGAAVAPVWVIQLAHLASEPLTSSSS